MGWNSFHNRGEILRAVVDTANDRRDGLLPVDVPGVAEKFEDDLDLAGALLLKWHARLSGNLERALAREPLDLESAVAGAWRTTAEQMPGVRLVIDHCVEHPTSAEMEHSMARARELEWMRLATLSGLASAQDATAVAAGRRVESLAREELVVPAQVKVETPVETPVDTPAQATLETPKATPGPSFADRIRAVLAA